MDTTIVRDRTFTGERIILSGFRYEKCTFNRCTFVFDGSGYSYADCEAIGCDHEFIGAAGATIAMLKRLWDIGDRRTVENVFRIIAGEPQDGSNRPDIVSFD